MEGAEEWANQLMASVFFRDDHANSRFDFGGTWFRFCIWNDWFAQYRKVSIFASISSFGVSVGSRLDERSADLVPFHSSRVTSSKELRRQRLFPSPRRKPWTPPEIKMDQGNLFNNILTSAAKQKKKKKQMNTRGWVFFQFLAATFPHIFEN